jgi:hypothetical protein
MTQLGVVCGLVQSSFVRAYLEIPFASSYLSMCPRLRPPEHTIRTYASTELSCFRMSGHDVDCVLQNREPRDIVPCGDQYCPRSGTGWRSRSRQNEVRQLFHHAHDFSHSSKSTCIGFMAFPKPPDRIPIIWDRWTTKISCRCAHLHAGVPIKATTA